jgi:uncharacterized protein (DUF1501 family)
MSISRRSVVRGLAASAALSTLPPSVRLAVAQPHGLAAASRRDTLVVVFLRGGMDGLQLLAPADNTDYVAARGADLRVLASGASAGLRIGNAPTAEDWRLHPTASPLLDLYRSGQLAFVHASGLMADTRSHFQAVDLMERGITDAAQIGSAVGWATRHLQSIGAIDGSFAAVATSTIPP